MVSIVLTCLSTIVISAFALHAAPNELHGPAAQRHGCVAALMYNPNTREAWVTLREALNAEP